MTSHLLAFFGKMKHSPIRNYGGIPGLTSWLIGEPGKSGLVRLLESSRNHQESIIPHSHRFDFHCIVLAGEVENILWERAGSGDTYQESALVYGGSPGQYTKIDEGVGSWSMIATKYGPGDQYEMAADQVHSIFFSRGASVLFFEGPMICTASLILQPVVDGEVVPTFEVKPWAFKREQAGGAS